MTFFLREHTLPSYALWRFLFIQLVSLLSLSVFVDVLFLIDFIVVDFF